VATITCPPPNWGDAFGIPSKAACQTNSGADVIGSLWLAVGTGVGDGAALLAVPQLISKSVMIIKNLRIVKLFY
jgi:hypothetical protein